MASLAAGEPPELSHGQPITCTALQAKGCCYPLDDVVKAIGEANIWDQVKRVCNVDGKQYGLVHAAGTSLLIYRKDLADKLGFKPPKTWADLLANAKALTHDTNGDGSIDIYGITHSRRQPVHQHHSWRAHQGQRRVLFDENNKPLLTDKKMIEVLGVLARARQVRASRLGGPRLPADFPEPLRAKGRHDVPGLRPWRRHDREVCA